MGAKCKIVDLNINHDSLCTKVFDLKPYWVNRSEFYTLGAASYIDDQFQYILHKEACNNILLNTFSDIYEKLCNYFGAELNILTAYPGFHIFDYKSNLSEASIHFDLSYKRLPIYKESFSNPQSFTICLAKPKSGAGLNIWEEIDIDELSDIELNQIKQSNQNIGQPEYIEYELGKMYVHSGHALHKIASNKILNNEYRITLQGHVISDGDKKYLYF